MHYFGIVTCFTVAAANCENHVNVQYFNFIDTKLPVTWDSDSDSDVGHKCWDRKHHSQCVTCLIRHHSVQNTQQEHVSRYQLVTVNFH